MSAVLSDQDEDKSPRCLAQNISPGRDGHRPALPGLGLRAGQPQNWLAKWILSRVPEPSWTSLGPVCPHHVWVASGTAPSMFASARSGAGTLALPCLQAPGSGAQTGQSSYPLPLPSSLFKNSGKLKIFTLLCVFLSGLGARYWGEGTFGISLEAPYRLCQGT